MLDNAHQALGGHVQAHGAEEGRSLGSRAGGQPIGNGGKEQGGYQEGTAANQAVRVQIDEEGVKAAAYIEFPGAGAAMPPEEIIDFILDRPFLFVITNRYDLPLFAGIVNNP